MSIVFDSKQEPVDQNSICRRFPTPVSRVWYGEWSSPRLCVVDETGGAVIATKFGGKGE